MPVDTIMGELPVIGGQVSENADSDELILTDAGFFWREKDGVKVLICQELEAAGFVNGFSTRLGGVSPFPENSLNLAGFDEDPAENIYENRRRFLTALGAPKMQLATAWQVHGDTIKVVSSAADVHNSDEHADALISELRGGLVGVKTADCVPVLIGDPQTRAFAAVHAGWRGTAQSIVSKTVEKLTVAFGSNPAMLICAIGPAACGRNYEVGQDVIAAFAENFLDIEKYFTPTREDHALVDLKRANYDQLIDCGIPIENIHTAPLCTMERPDLFFSYRLEKKKYGKTGRLLSVIGAKS
jgi:YfiH family protein